MYFLKYAVEDAPLQSLLSCGKFIPFLYMNCVDTIPSSLPMLDCHWIQMKTDFDYILTATLHQNIFHKTNTVARDVLRQPDQAARQNE